MSSSSFCRTATGSPTGSPLAASSSIARVALLALKSGELLASSETSFRTGVGSTYRRWMWRWGPRRRSVHRPYEQVVALVYLVIRVVQTHRWFSVARQKGGSAQSP